MFLESKKTTPSLYSFPCGSFAPLFTDAQRRKQGVQCEIEFITVLGCRGRGCNTFLHLAGVRLGG